MLAAVAVCALLFVRAAAGPAARTSGSRVTAISAKPSTRTRQLKTKRSKSSGKRSRSAPNSARERLNFGLALLRAGKTAEGIAELVQVQKQDPSIPHTWFNLGIAYKKAGEQEKAIAQFEQMVKLVPDDAVSHYNLGALYRVTGRMPEAIEQFRDGRETRLRHSPPRISNYSTCSAHPGARTRRNPSWRSSSV